MPALVTPAMFAGIGELFSGRTGTAFDSEGHREYVRRFLVLVNSRVIGPEAVCFHPLLPRPFSPYMSGSGLEYDLRARLIKLSAEQPDSDDWFRWIVTATYSTVMPKGGPNNAGAPHDSQGPQNNPEQENPDVEWDWETVRKPLKRDLDGKPFVSSALQPLTPSPTFEVAYPVLIISRNELDFQQSTAQQYAYAVNSDWFLRCPPGTVQCMPPKAKMVFKGDLQYWRVTYRFRFNREIEDGKLDTWQPEFADMGLCRLGTAADGVLNGKTIQILRPAGVPVSYPVLLDGKGQEALNQTVQVFAGAVQVLPSPVWLKFRVYKSLPFKAIFKKGFGAKFTPVPAAGNFT